MPSGFLDSRQFHVEFEALDSAPPARAIAEFEWALDRLDVRGAVYCAGALCWSTARAAQVTIDSLVRAVCAYATRLQEYDQTPEGQAELAGGSASLPSESFVKTIGTCSELMQAAIDHGPKGFAAYRDASPYLHSPSGWTLRKHVAEAEFDGESAPIRARVSAAFNSAKKCKGATTRFEASKQQDLLQVRELVCETMARKYGKPTYTKRDLVEWTVEFDDARVSTEVELDGFGNGWCLDVRVGIKRFW